MPGGPIESGRQIGVVADLGCSDWKSALVYDLRADADGWQGGAHHLVCDAVKPSFAQCRPDLIEVHVRHQPYSVTPRASATVLMSLSPRPERLITTTSSGRSAPRAPRARTWATAWEDSSAGMMPSSSHRVWKARRAAASSAAT